MVAKRGLTSFSVLHPQNSLWHSREVGVELWGILSPQFSLDQNFSVQVCQTNSIPVHQKMTKVLLHTPWVLHSVELYQTRWWTSSRWQASVWSHQMPPDLPDQFLDWTGQMLGQQTVAHGPTVHGKYPRIIIIDRGSFKCKNSKVSKLFGLWGFKEPAKNSL